jgi:hypothetical protein
MFTASASAATEYGRPAESYCNRQKKGPHEVGLSLPWHASRGLDDVEPEWLVIAVYDAGRGVGSDRFAFRLPIDSCIDVHRITDNPSLDSRDIVAHTGRVTVVKSLPDFGDTRIDLIFESGACPAKMNRPTNVRLMTVLLTLIMVLSPDCIFGRQISAVLFSRTSVLSCSKKMVCPMSRW